MTSLEILAQGLERRIQKIRENPDPDRIRSHLFLYEAQLEQAKALLEGTDADKPLVDADVEGLARTMGFRVLKSFRIGDEFGKQEPEEILEQVRALEYPDYVCDKTVSSLPAMLRSEMPKPQIILSALRGCEPQIFVQQAYAGQLGIPHFVVDTPFEDDYKSNLGYVTEQLKALIEFAEANVPGVKYDEDKLAEWQELEAEYYGYWHDIYELRKRVPCPDHPRDVFREVPKLANFPNPATMLQWAREYRDELREKADRGYTPAGKEKLRVMWAVTGPYNIPVWEHLAGRGVSVVVKYSGPTRLVLGIGRPASQEEYGRKLSPLEEQARILLSHSWHGTARRWLEDGLYICRDANIEALINFDQVNCTPCQGLAPLLAEAAERELGIPTLNIQSRQMFTSMGMGKDDLYEQLDNFIDKCLRRKGYQP